MLRVRCGNFAPFFFLNLESIIMSKATVSLVKKSAGLKAVPHTPGKLKTDVFVFQDNEDSTCTVFGVDQAGQQVDISGVATIAVTSSDVDKLTVAAPTGTTFKMSGVAPGSATVTTTAIWNDGSVGPFTFDLPCQVTNSPVGGLTVIPGTPVVR